MLFYSHNVPDTIHIDNLNSLFFTLYWSDFVHFIFEIKRFHNVVITNCMVYNYYTSLIDLSVLIFNSCEFVIS